MRTRRQTLAGLGTLPWLACAASCKDLRPPVTPDALLVSLPAISRGTLVTGTDFYMTEAHGLPLVSLAVIVRAGSSDDPVGQEGMAKLSAELVLAGMEGGDRITLLERYGELGATPRAWVRPSLLGLSCTVHRDDAAAALRLMVDNLRFPTLSAESFERAKREHLEWLDASRGHPTNIAGLGLLLGIQGIEPPVATLGWGTSKTIDGLTIDAMRAWMATHVQRDTTAVLLAGDLGPDEALDAIDASIRGWSASTLPPAARPPPQPVGSKRARAPCVLVPWPGLPQAILAFGGSRRPLGHADEPTEAFVDAFMHGVASYELRTRLRTTYGIEPITWATTTGLVQALSAKIDPGDMGAAIEHIRDYLRSFTEEHQLSPSIVNSLRRTLMNAMMNDFEGPEAALAQLIELAARGLPPATYSERLDRLMAIDSAEATATLRRAYDDERLHLCVVGDGDAILQARQALGDGMISRQPEELVGHEPGPSETFFLPLTTDHLD